MSYEAFSRAVEAAGSQSAFERITGMSQQMVSYRLKHQKVLPAEYVLRAEAGTGISRHDLRPDLYPRGSIDPADLLPVGQCGPVVACDRPAISQHKDVA